MGLAQGLAGRCSTSSHCVAPQAVTLTRREKSLESLEKRVREFQSPLLASPP